MRSRSPLLVSICKPGNEPGDNEDAGSWSVTSSSMVLAVSDGAAVGMCSALWARLLARAFVARPIDVSGEAPHDRPRLLERWAEPLRERWAKHSRRQLRGFRGQFNVEHQYRLGAAATLIGVALSRCESSWRCSALAVGDSNLFVVQDDELVAAFPISDPESFGSAPELIAVRPPPFKVEPAAVAAFDDRLEGPTTLVLCSDALARWFLVEAHARRRPWAWLRSCGEAEFEAVMREEATAGRIHADDLTALVAQLS